MNHFLRTLFFVLVVRPFATLVLGINVRNHERLPLKGPAILVANHNSHLDTVVLASLFPVRAIHQLRPVAAADYFLKKRGLLSWFSEKIVGIIPISRTELINLKGQKEDPLKGISDALAEGSILFYFPEGTRGEPERMARFKSGIARIAEKHPDVPICPIFLHGSGKALPKGEGMLVPFFIDVFIGHPMKWNGSKNEFLSALEGAVQTLPGDAFLAAWD